MIYLCVDEAYAFDYLSILNVKKNLSQRCRESWTECYNSLEKQFPNDKWQEIINSEEYLELENANKNTFYAIEGMRRGEISAKEVDDSNTKRYEKKIHLQKKFFNKDLREYKT